MKGTKGNFAKKYRQRKINDMIGSLNVRTSLTTLLEKDKLPNAIILYGDNGIGKTSIAYCLAFELMCGCGSSDCPICTELTEQLWDYKDRALTNVFEFDLGQHKDDSAYVDSIFDAFLVAGKKVLIIDEIQDLSSAEMSKFLKTLEKLDDDTYVIFCTTQLYKVNSGIISRCEVFELQVPNTFELSAYLESICRMESVQYDREGIYALAKMKYRVRDAVSSLETIINVYGSVRKDDVRNYFGKSDSQYPIEYLRATKESSPYGMLFLLQKIKEDTGLHKFTVALKEMLVDSVYARYGIKPLFASEEDVEELKRVINIFSTEELTHILKETDKMQSRTNLDKEVVLINLGFALSNGSLLKKTGVEEEKKFFKKSSEDSMLTENKNLQDPIKVTEGFTLLSKSEVDKEDRETTKNTSELIRIDNEESVLNMIDDLFK